MFNIDPSTGNLTANTPASIDAGTQPWPIVVDPTGKFVYVGNEDSATISTYRLNNDGTLTSTGSAATLDGAFSVGVTKTK
jgi:6-phosphogluconolactonase